MRTLPYGFPLLDLVHELSFSTAQLNAHPLGAPYLKDFEDLLAENHKALQRQLELIAAQAIAEAKVVRADDVLNQHLDVVNLNLLSLTDRNRAAPLYQRFFGNQRPSEAKRPILGAQLELMRDWVPTLLATGNPELKALAAPIDAAVKAADASVAALRVAEQQLADFSEIGDCKELIDKVNGTRKATHGKLAEAMHKNAGENLPVDFADQFFIREPRWNAPNRQELTVRIAKTEQQLVRLKQQLAEQDERQAQAERAQRAAEAELLRAQVAASERRVADERARAAALKSKLEQLAPSVPPQPAPPSIPPTA